MKYWLIIVSFLLIYKTNGQTCNCLDNLQFIIDKVEMNHSGFKDIINTKNKNVYISFTDSVKKQATYANEQECLPLLKKWLKFFQDPHLVVTLNTPLQDTVLIRKIFVNTEKIEINEEEIKNYFKKIKEPIEGIWETWDGSNRIAIIKNTTINRDFVGVVLKGDGISWMQNQVKMEIKKTGKNTYEIIDYLRDHSPDKNIVFLGENYLSLHRSRWRKIFPESGGRQYNHASASGIYLKKLDKKTCLLVLPTFHPDYKNTIDSILDANTKLLIESTNLIIDVRNNVGGFNNSFDKIIPYLYTNPIIIQGASIWATPENIEAFSEFPYLPNISEERKKIWIERIKKMEENKNTYVNIYPNDTLRLNHILPNPKHIIVLINEKTVSSGEFFVERAKQSTKVTLMGVPTAGGTGYASFNILPLPCNIFALYYPTSRNNRLSDNTSSNFLRIQPDVLLSDEVADWIKFAQNYLKKYEK